MKTLSSGLVRLLSLVPVLVPVLVPILVAGLLVASVAGVVAAGADSPDSGPQATTARPLSPMAVLDGSQSANAAVLFDGTVGAGDAVSWTNAGNPWTEESYPMEVTVDLGRIVELVQLRYYGGQIPHPAEASLTVEVSVTGAADDYVVAAVGASPAYDQWSRPLGLGGIQARYVRIGFNSLRARFNLAEVAIEGRSAAGVETTLVTTPASDLDGEIDGVTATDRANSVWASRLVDGREPPGTDNGTSWENPQPWNTAAYPMTAVLDLGDSYAITGLSYFVGNIDQGTDQVNFEYSAAESGEDYLPLVTVSDGHQWNRWRDVSLAGQTARRVRIRFDSPEARFNISEVRFRSGEPPSPTTIPSPTIPSPTVPTTGPTTAVPTTPVPTTPVPTTPVTQSGDQPQAGPPPASVVRSHGFGNWPGDHLSPGCRTLHDSYWTTGPNPDPANAGDPNHAQNKAYHTWHPALAVDEGTGERCDFGHEHGFSPKLAPAELFDLSGGWPAFGYVAETLGGARHEDHVGHKVTVARFRAAIGNGAGSEPLYDAGFECDWLSKIHQGSSTLDAFANHLHEYFLTLRCFDGLNAQGRVDNTVVGTRFSVKVMYTYGNPDRFVEEGCIGDDPSTPTINETEFPASVLTGPEGQAVMPAQRTTPLGNDKPNSRAFVCSNSVLWKDFSQIQSIDLWTQLIKIQRNTGATAITIQPYYIVKNPARIVKGYDSSAGERPSQVIRTISLCYDDAGNRLDRPLCGDAPLQEPHWTSPDSPFNGTLRAINFKASHLQNSVGPERFCTDPFGFAVQDPAPCQLGNILQQANQFDNHWNDGRYRFGERQGNIQGSVWADDPYGNRFAATPSGGDSYRPNGIGFEFIVDNRNPDDDLDGMPDGASIRGQN